MRKNYKQSGSPKKVRTETHIKAWRTHRELTQERLADRIGMSSGNLSLLERGLQDYTQSTLEALANALRCDPVDLLIRDPSEPESVWSLWDSIDPLEKPQAIEILGTFKKKRSA